MVQGRVSFLGGSSGFGCFFNGFRVEGLGVERFRGCRV